MADLPGNSQHSTNALVAVVIPAYNAEPFIERTLASVLAQTHRNIEIIVVDDGSTDGTASIVRRLADSDGRIKLLQQKNGGVASARNAGARASKGIFIAPIDADDLWHPTKLEKQLHVFAAAGNDLGLVYTLYRTIDADDLVILTPKRTHPNGWVFMQHLGQNFIGNGSSAMFRRDVLFEMGGYSSRLRQSGAEGCEDFFIQQNIASKYRFGVVEEHLVGYRRTPGNMSADFVRMLISRRMVLESVLARCTEAVKPVLLDAMFRTDVEIAKLGLMTRRFAAVAKHCTKMLWRSPVQFAKLVAAFANIFLRKVKRALPQPENQDRSSEIGRNFWNYSVHEFADFAENANYRGELSNLAVMDEELGPTGAYLTRPPEEGTLAMPSEDTNSSSLLRPLET
ncbi:glycosyltransferase family 2 protein [Mesorhizobium sp. M1C.F.Ca.ET.193.01.1.1]|uniref:glycosyltransferase family 2 protein n=2 Tax=Mesorhizobium TaxID=68287 RepID=UPI000FD3181D|nr:MULTISPECIES: glycosyltransferase family 2 protein [unclassified Mesorhizobium]TGS91658.1 glycosyltransferase family 2 protein [bacterium M00.F.Ca.ET.177.01.1.1]TGQ49891.1 glycosyltransferase family 2 protein [Mesorhizobium sp. M1C.F.Ca.ET.210.01.1.1]TGQ64353.1 glycosyltransferase family 2 protein [Mesorhizobium sp. M1C.F.Ca.ET.212.01.1.1]TGQ98089.1 glycosyltransferase family 2 protein [Mesorhizobium sp. M1C.F.Ca.ET.204.01.1.1]TGR18341.1 glycosyltransferase family 2 protein [Mesorhizobium s